MPLYIFRDTFVQMAALMLLMVVVGAIITRLRQPLIVGSMLVGILAGPSGLRWVTSTDEVHLLSQLGLTLLLFVVGLKLDVNLIRSMGPVALAAGIVQIIVTLIGGYLISKGLGFGSLSSIYIAAAVTCSSTIIAIKLLSDRREADSLHGRIAIGILIVQDLLVVVAMIVLSGMAANGSQGVGKQILMLAGKGFGLLLGLAFLTRFIIPWLLGRMAHSQELLVLFAITWAILVASISGMLGFSIEVGALLAGVTLASTTYRDAIGSRLVSLRDFLLLFFFIELGTRINLHTWGQQIWASILLSIFVLTIKPLAILSVMGFMGYRRRTSLFSSITLAQISEFSLILAAMGLQLKHISPDIVGLITLVGLITVGLSTYMAVFGNVLYAKLSPYLRFFERKVPHAEEHSSSEHSGVLPPEVILFGIGRYGSAIGYDLLKAGRKVLGVDFDAYAVRRWNKRGWNAWYGDAEDPEFPGTLPLSSAKWVVSSIRNGEINAALTSSLRNHGFTGMVALTAQGSAEAQVLKKTGAEVVFYPFRDAADRAAEILEQTEQHEARIRMDKLIANLSDHYIVCGYGRMGQQIVKDLRKEGVPLVVIEFNPEQVPKLAEGVIPYIEGRASEDEVLLKAGVKRARGIVAVTATDEENVFIVLSAKSLNPKLYIVARSILEENEGKLRRAGADRVMSPYVLGGHRIAAAVLQSPSIDFCDLVVHDRDRNVQIINMPITADSPCTGQTLEKCNLWLKTGAFILAVTREGEMQIGPGPDFVPLSGDELVVMGTPIQLENATKLLQKKES
ncbi:MAG: cation:proton antiporter [bacterium]